MENLELGKEYPLLGEEEAIHQIAKISRELLNQDQEPVRRQQHAKHHGCVRGQFIVEANLPEKIRFGIFREPKHFTAWIRFSNASGNAQQPDSKDDVRGMAIKLTNVEGEKLLVGEKQTQDFVMINHPVFSFAISKTTLNYLTQSKRPRVSCQSSFSFQVSIPTNDVYTSL